MAENLKARREQLGFSLRDVEAITKGRINNGYLSQLETGKVKNPSVAVACDLAAAYALPLDTIVEMIGTPPALRPIEICQSCGQAIPAHLLEHSK